MQTSAMDGFNSGGIPVARRGPATAHVLAMNVVLQSVERTLISVSPDELVGIRSALREVCNNTHLTDGEFQTRFGVTRDALVSLLAQVPSPVSAKRGVTERADVWADGGSVHVMCMSASGDPVELGETEAAEFASRLQLAIAEAG